jgi:hypothetical protein
MLRAALAGLQKGSAVRLPRFPDRLKGGRIERWKNYWLGVATDYREALLEMGQGARQRPLRASVIVSLIGKYGTVFLTYQYPYLLITLRDEFTPPCRKVADTSRHLCHCVVDRRRTA